MHAKAHVAKKYTHKCFTKFDYIVPKIFTVNITKKYPRHIVKEKYVNLPHLTTT